MLTKLIARSRARGDDGVALVVAIALLGLSGTLMLTMMTLVIREGRQTGHDRARATAVTTAEGGVDKALANIQTASVAGVPCGSSTSTVSQAKPESMSITTTVTYYDAAGAVVSCSTIKNGTVTATQALIKAVSTGTPSGGGQTVKRSVESLVQLKPKYANDLDKAIFGNSAVVVENSFDLYGQSGPDADIYTNGDFTCSHNEHYRGSIYAQGSITLSNSCTIDVNAWAKTGFTSNNTQSTVSGDVLVSNGSANISAGTVGGKVKAVSITPSSYCTANPSKCVTGTGATTPPIAVSFPQVGDSTTSWVAAGYTVVTKNDCSSLSSSNNPGSWIDTQGQSLTGKTLLVTSCMLEFDTSVKTIDLSNDLAIFASGGVSLSNSLIFKSTNTTNHYLYFIQPYSSTCTNATVGGKSYKRGIYLGNQVQMESTISELLYTPCDVIKANLSSTYGQIYAGGTAYISNNTSAYYVPIPVFGAIATKIVTSYTADILYKRETLS
jgi:Tfp pilus assembly protein PilX